MTIRGLVRRSFWLLATTVALTVDSIAIACSGPGAPETIARNERLGLVLWAATILVGGGAAFVPRLRARGLRRLWPLLLLAVVHPGWWMSARSGDCGAMLASSSVAVSALTPLVVGFLFWRAGLVRRTESRSP